MTSGSATLDRKKPLLSLLSMLAPSRGRLALAILAFVIKDSPGWVMPLLTAGIIDVVAQAGSLVQLFTLGGLAVGLTLLNFPATLVWVRLFNESVRELAVTLRNQLAYRLQELSIGFHNRTPSSIIQTKVVRDVENIELMLQQSAHPVLSTIGILGGASIVLAIQLPLFLLIYVVLVPASAVLVHWISRKSGGRNEDFRKEMERFSSSVSEMATVLPITRAHSVEEVAAERVVSSAKRVRDTGLRLDLLNGKFGSLAWITFSLLTILSLVSAATLSMTGTMAISTGQIVLLGTYFGSMTGSVLGLLGLAPIFTKGRESVLSLTEVLDEPDVEENAGKKIVTGIVGELAFANVTFQFDDDDTPVLTALDLKIHAGETVALVGASGSGKSTILNLVLGFIRPDHGVITLDGIDMNTLDLRSVRKHVSVVPQESVLLSGTVRDNITYGLENVIDEVVWEALDNAFIGETVRAMEHGLDTVVGERGTRLSGGQRQRLSIARALIRNPKILLLDEATSALDTESERAVQEALGRLMRGRTTLVVAHRLSTIRSAHRIIVMRNGRIIESGSHETLMKTNSEYSRLVKTQTSGH